MIWSSASPDETEEVGRRLAREIAPEGVLLLEGDLGAGKTTLVRGIATELGVPAGRVRSPTFTLMNEYGSRFDLLHVDLYRLEGDEILALGLEERLAAPGVKVVEWADRLPFPTLGAWTLRIDVLPDGVRRLACDEFPESSSDRR